MKGCLKTVLIIFVCFVVLTIGIGIGVSMMGDGSDTSNPPSGTQGTNQYITQIYTWNGEGLFSSGNATVSFQGGKVISKAQFGLD